MSLCESCARFDVQAFKADPKREIAARGIPCSTIVDGANAGCNFCSLLISAFEDEHDGVARASLSRWFEIIPSRVSPSKPGAIGMGLEAVQVALLESPLQIGSSTHIDTIPKVTFRVAADPKSTAARSGDVAGLIPQDDPLSKNSVAHMRSWLDNCTEKHRNCSISISGALLDHRNAPLPTRCLMIDAVDEHGDLIFHLQETLGRTGCYITLSHRWDDDTETSKTTVLNVQDRRLGKSLNVPPLFRDTLRLAHRLGVPYVWIDSVCIVQDGGEWATESLKMADYYQQSILTISAASNSTATEGLALFKIPVERMPTLARLPYRDKDGQQRGYIYLYQTAKSLLDSYQDMLSKADLLKRGWVFQEWSLSRRIACFASHTPGYRIFLHCQQEPPTNEVGDVVPIRESAIYFWGDRLRFATNSPLLLWHQWQVAVQRYSAASLTKPEKDRIIALAGVAKECREAIRMLANSGSYENEREEITPSVRLNRRDSLVGAYVAGLWLTDIHSGLLWSQRCERSNERQRIPGFPTWSWASILVPVAWDHDDQKRSVKVARLAGVTTTEGIFHSPLDINSEGNASKTEALKYLDIDCMFGVLHFRGCLIPVGVIGYMTEDQWIRRFEAQLPGLNVSMYGDWRNVLKINLPSRPSTVCGWGTLEHPDFQIEKRAEPLDALYAFPVSRGSTSRTSSGGTFADFWNVVYVVPVGGGYEGVGAGCIFGPDVEKGIKAAEHIEIKLC